MSCHFDFLQCALLANYKSCTYLCSAVGVKYVTCRIYIYRENNLLTLSQQGRLPWLFHPRCVIEWLRI